jgi:CRP/FNR family cyclic AMP-dependent transcriptional regulator
MRRATATTASVVTPTETSTRSSATEPTVGNSRRGERGAIQLVRQAPGHLCHQSVKRIAYGAVVQKKRVAGKMILDAQIVDYGLLEHPELPTRKVAKGETVIRQNDNLAAEEMFFVRSGSIAISINGKTVETVMRGGIFGELAMIDRAPRSATVTAREDTVLVPIDQRTFLVFAEAMPLFALEVMRILAERLRIMNESVATT